MRKKKTNNQKQGKRRCGDGVKEVARGVQVPDEHHNSMTPCCDLVRDIVNEIFPSISEAKKAGSNDDVSQSTNAAGKSSLEVERQSSQPLLGLMIHHSLLQQRIQMRSQQGRAASETKTQILEHDMVASQQQKLTAKRKKKKKKKRKKSSDTNEKYDDGSDQDERRPLDAVMNREESRILQGLNNFDDEAHSLGVENAAPPTDHDYNPQDIIHPGRSYSDCFLDSIIDSADSHHSTERKNRDINSFATYLSQKYQSFLETQHSHKKSKSTHNNSEKELINILPTISLLEIHFYTCHIECRQCRSAVHSHLQKLVHTDCAKLNLPWGRRGVDEHFDSCKSKGKVVILDENDSALHRRPHHQDAFIPVSMDDDKLFNYVAMDDDVDLEAGQEVTGTDLTPRQPCFRLEFRIISIADQKFLQLQPLATSTDGEREKLQYPLSSEDVINLVKSVILPCGMENTEIPPADQCLSDDEFEFIVESARRSSAEHRKKFYNIQNIMKQMHSLFDDASTTNTRCQFDATTTKSLNQCDEFCGISLKYIGEFLLIITKLSCFVGWSNEYGPYLMECMVNCWSQFDVTLDKLVAPTMEYRGCVLRCCTRPGQVPQMYFNKTIRDNFLEYIGRKMAMIDKLVFYLETTLISPKHKSYRGKMHHAPSPLVRLCVLEAFLSHSYRSESFRSSAVSVFPNVDDESEFNKLLAARITLSQAVIRSPTKKNIEQKEKQSFCHVKDLYAFIVESVISKLVELENGTQSAPDFIKQCHDSYASQRDKAERELNCKPENITPELASALLNTSRLLTMQWIYLLCMRQSYTSVQFALPSRLDDWMESLSGSDIVQAEPDKDGGVKCDGSGAKRRVSCVLAALLYRWLEARCSEWHAEVTQDELLKSVDFDELTVREVSSKSGKVKKGKKKIHSSGDKVKISHTPKLIGSNGTECIENPDKNQPAAAIDDNNDTEVQLSYDDESQVTCDEAEQTHNAKQEIKVIEVSDKFTSLHATDLEQPVTQHKSGSQLADSTGKKVTGAEEVNIIIEEKICATEPSTFAYATHEMKVSETSPSVTRSFAEDNVQQIKHRAESKLKESDVREFGTKSSSKKNTTTKKTAKESISTVEEKNKAITCSPPQQEDCYDNVHFLHLDQLQPTSTFVKKNETESKSNYSKDGAAQTCVTSQSTRGMRHLFQSPETESKPVVHSLESSPTAEGKLASQQHPKLTYKDIDDSDVKSTAHDLVTFDIQPSVGVIDNDTVIPAEDFLVGRMEAVLAEINAIRSRYTMWF